MSSETPKLAVTLSEVCEMLSYSATKVRQLISTGRLATIGHGRGLRVVVASIHAYLAEGDGPAQRDFGEARRRLQASRRTRSEPPAPKERPSGRSGRKLNFER